MLPNSFYLPCNTICINQCLLVAWCLHIWLGLGWASSFADHSAYQQNVTNPLVLNMFCFPMLETHYEQVQVFALSSWNMWGTHHQSTLAITMNCVQHGAILIVLALGLAHTMTKTTADFWNVDSCSCTSSGFCGHPLNAQLVGTSWD